LYVQGAGIAIAAAIYTRNAQAAIPAAGVAVLGAASLGALGRRSLSSLRTKLSIMKGLIDGITGQETIAISAGYTVAQARANNTKIYDTIIGALQSFDGYNSKEVFGSILYNFSTAVPTGNDNFGNPVVKPPHSMLIDILNKDSDVYKALRGNENNFGDRLDADSPVKLTYIKTTDGMKPEVVEVVKEGVTKDKLERVGKLRFDTKLVRNVFFIANVVRLVRLKLNRDLTHSRNILVSSHASVASGITEYGIDPFDTNEVWSSKISSNAGRFVDSDGDVMK